MMTENKTTYILCTLLLALGAYFQLNSFLNPDNAWLVDSAQMLLSGRNLYTDYIETNPPFIVYFTALPIWVGGLIGIKSYIAFTLMVLAVGVVSFVGSLKYLQSNNLRIGVALLFFIFPAASFGQREHLLVMFIFPYFMALLNHKKPNKTDVVMFILGMLLKPYFVVFFALFALWAKFELKHKLFSLRHIIIGCCGILYLFLIWFFEHDYITNVLPLLLKYYDSFYYERVGLAFKIGVIISPLVLYFIKRLSIAIFDSKMVFSLLAAAAAGLTILLQNKGWTNHHFPMNFFIILALIIFIENCNNKFTGKDRIIFLGALSSVYLVAMILAFKFNFDLICDAAKYSEQENIKVIEQYAPQEEALAIGFNLNTLYPEILYSSAKMGWRYPCMWMLMGMYKNDHSKILNQRLPFHTKEQQGEDERAIFDSLVEYFITARPKILVIDDQWIGSKQNNNSKSNLYKFDLAGYFVQDRRFAVEFEKYRLVRKFLGKNIYIRNE